MTKSEKEVLNNAIEIYGKKPQIIKAVEELSELSQALCKYMNRDCFRDNKLVAHIIEEIADVEVMTTQLKMIFDCKENVDKTKEFKINRLNNRLEELIKEREQ